MKKTKSDELLELLQEDILSGKLPPGTRLTEEHLAAQFGVSRTPVREALKQLAANRFADMVPHKGVVVTNIPPELMQEMFEAMAELEAACARLAALKMTSEERAHLKILHQRCDAAAQASDILRYHEANLDFHTAIYQGSRNGFLAEMTINLRNRLTPFRKLQFRNTGRVYDSYKEHDSVVQAIVQADVDQAYHAMHEHILIVGDSFVQFTSRLQPVAYE